MGDMTTKKCSKCGEIKALNEFNKHKKVKCGYNSQCRACHKITRDRWNKSHLDRRCEIQQAYYNREKEEINAKRRQHRLDNIEKYRLYERRDTDTLSDSYVKQCLRFQGWCKEDITPEIIEVKRLEILIKRHIRNGK